MRLCFVPALLSVALAAGCGDGGARPLLTDTWAGRWHGPEGTYVEIEGTGGSYSITVQDLDSTRTFQGSAAGERIEFRRDGIGESLRATNGDETGMKWLAGKTRCLTIKPGEGYCRD
jgi:hypothetical protein